MYAVLYFVTFEPLRNVLSLRPAFRIYVANVAARPSFNVKVASVEKLLGCKTLNALPYVLHDSCLYSKFIFLPNAFPIHECLFQ